MREPLKVLISPDVLEMFSGRTDDGRRIDMHAGEPDEDGISTLYAYSVEDEMTQSIRDGIAMAKLIGAPAWGAEEVWIEWDHQDHMARVKISGYTTVGGTGKTIEEACDNALRDLEERNSMKSRGTT